MESGRAGSQAGSQTNEGGETAEASAEGETTSAQTGDGPRTTEEERAALDQDLDSSLSEFDRLLLREQELLAAQREAAAAAGGGASGEDPGAEALGGGGTGGSPDTPPGDPAEPAGSEPGAPVGDKETETANGRVPPDVGDGNDDDIVARQLREAAMKEEDPELREKLWDEYRAYKEGVKKGS